MSKSTTISSIIPKISHDSACKVLDCLEPSELVTVSRTSKFAHQCIFYPVGNEHPKGANYRTLVCNRISYLKIESQGDLLAQILNLSLVDILGRPIAVPRIVQNYMEENSSFLRRPLTKKLMDTTTNSLVSNPKLTLYLCVAQLKALNLPGFTESQRIMHSSAIKDGAEMQRTIRQHMQDPEVQQKIQQISTTGRRMLDESIANLQGIERTQRASMNSVFNQIRSKHTS